MKEKDNTLKSAKVLYSIKNDIIDAFEKDVFPYTDGFHVEKEADEDIDDEIDTTQSYLNQKAKNLLQKEEINKEKA